MVLQGSIFVGFDWGPFAQTIMLKAKPKALNSPPSLPLCMTIPYLLVFGPKALRFQIVLAQTLALAQDLVGRLPAFCRLFPKIQLPRTPLTFSILTCTQIPHVNSAFHRKAHRCHLLSCGSWEAEPAAGGCWHTLWGCSGEVVMMRYTWPHPKASPTTNNTHIYIYI